MPPRVVAIVHEYDLPMKRRLFRRAEPSYLLGDIFAVLRQRGCTATFVSGPARHVEADIAILHVDATRVPEEYARAGRRYLFCLNVGVVDISKSAVSDAILSQGDDWAGPVIVKTDLNNRGRPEARKNRRAGLGRRALPFPDAASPRPYVTYGSVAEVPAAFWDDPDLVVERFLPEPMPDGFAMCHYVFCGDYEYCGRFVSPYQMVKGKDVFRWDHIEVPEHIRERRRALGFDYGKFDFAQRDGRAYLLDANKTPGRIPAAGGASLEGLADGLLGLLDRRG